MNVRCVTLRRASNRALPLNGQKRAVAAHRIKTEWIKIVDVSVFFLSFASQSSLKSDKNTNKKKIVFLHLYLHTIDGFWLFFSSS